MRIVFFGSSEFSLPFLEYLFLERKDELWVVTCLDRPKGRGLKILPNPVKEFCLKNNLRVYQFKDINSLEAKDSLKKFEPDLFVVVAYGQIFSKEILEIPKIFSINVHASLLPKYRGAAPINWAIINGEKETGISIIKMEEKVDCGPIILQKNIAIDIDDDSFTLEEKLKDLGKIILIEAIKKIEEGDFSLTIQDKRYVSFAPKLKKRDGLIDWNKSAIIIHNLIRGCRGWPSAFTYYKSKLLKIHKSNYVQSTGIDNYLPGEVIDISKEGILVACGKDRILIKKLQMEGKREMSAEEFICGHKIAKGEILG
ncbi:MAG: methionyl-tRNA formyltransferase [Candidatus Omnitrophica bacterium]|nr:methionyl-tRNA formyltransferase [Candidatus Omnitrophota bacterium]